MSTKDEIPGWLDEAKRTGCTHMLVVVDTFDWEDYPVYVKKGENLNTAIEEHSINMQQVMECFALHLNIEEQLKERRAYHTEIPEREIN